MKLSLHLLSAAAFAPLASAGSYETVFKFKDDFFLKFCGLSVGMGKADGEALIAGLNANVDAFKTTWTQAIKNIEGCEVVGGFPDPEFSMCDWKYPERYDTGRLPLAAECHQSGGKIDGVGDGSDCYIQRLFYQITNLKVKCPKKLDIEELKRSELLTAALEEMTPLALAADNSNSPWGKATDGVDEVQSNDECNALLSINRYTNIDVALKCLKEEFTTDTADMLKNALDEYFEMYAVPKIKETVENESPMSAVFSVKSPYDKDGDTTYCYYPSSYEDGTLVEQYATDDGKFVAKFKCGFDLVWFQDKNFNESLLPDLVSTVQNVFTDDTPSFLTFLQGKNTDVAWIANTEECGVIDPNINDPPTPNPTTAPPTMEPTKSPTEAPTTSPTQKPTAAPSQSPTSSPTDSPTNSPTTSANPTSPTDTPAPTQSPTTAAPTSSPTNSPTRNPTSDPTSSPTGSPTRNPTKAPTASPMVIPINTPSPVSGDCVIKTNVTEEQAPYVSAGSGTCGFGNIGDGICPEVGQCCSKWGWCGYSSQHCDDQAPTDTTQDPNLGKCGAGNGVTGDGTCLGENECCSRHGYCGTGDQYCSVTVNTETNESSEGKCGGGGVGEGKCFNEGDCCSEYGFCGQTSDYCTGVKPRVDGDTNTGGSDNNSPLPDNLKAQFGFRCGKTETDARSNCKKECTHARGDNNGNGPCEDDEECWGVQLNYCHTFNEGEHPVCTDLTKANYISRCGVDEVSARGHCGNTCNSDSDCSEGWPVLCFSVMENLCTCHEENLGMSGMPLPDSTGDVNDTFFEGKPNVTDDELNERENPFFAARERIMPYFVKSVGEGTVEGRGDNASFEVNMSVALVVIVSLNALFSYFM